MIRKRNRIAIIVVFCLLALSVAPVVGVAPAENDDPYPWLNPVDAPDSIVIGDSFTVDIEAVNYGGPTGEYSTVTISSPSLDESDGDEQVEITDEDFKGYTTIEKPGNTIYNQNGEPFTAKHTLIEGGTTSAKQWEAQSERKLSVKFTPEETGTFTIYYRVGLTNDTNTSHVFTDPGSAEVTDQQGFDVKTIKVDVKPKPEIDATLTDTSFEGGDYERGETVEGSAEIKNTGNRKHTYFVGYSLYDPHGKAYNSDAATTVTLSQGKSQSVELDWEIPEGARSGAYDPRVSVWKESDPEKLENRLADTRDNGAFTVRKEANIDAAITNADIDDGKYRDDEKVDARVNVENTGNREHTYYVGYSVIGPDYTVYDVSGETVTLAPGGTQEIDLSWTIPSDADAGSYDARASVWKESDPSNLQTRLADFDKDDHFQVRPQEPVTFTVTEAQSNRLEGDPIPGATISMRGQEYTTDENGKVKITLPVNDYSYTVSAPGHESEQGTLRMTANSGTHLEFISLEQEGVETITVDVVDNASEPLAANKYEIKVDGEQMTPNRWGQIPIEKGTHTVTVVPTEFGETEGVERVEKEVVVDEDGAFVTMTAVPKQYTLSINVPEKGGGVTLDNSDSVDTDVSRTYEEGTTVTLTAKAAVGYEFDRWEGSYPAGKRTKQSLSITLDDDTSLTPTFGSTGTQTIVGYDPQTEEFNNYTVSRDPDIDFASSSATLPDDTDWKDVSPPDDDYLKHHVSKNERYPWSAVGYLTVGLKGGHCSATVIDNNHIITAGHCVYTEGNGWDAGSSIEFVPGRNGNKQPFSDDLNTPEVEYIQTYEQWVNGNNIPYDTAVLTLDENVGAETGTFGYRGRSADASIYTRSQDESPSLHFTGYPADEADYVNTKGEQWDLIADGQGTEFAFDLQSCDENRKCHKVATGGDFEELLWGGQSGGAVWSHDDAGHATVVSVMSVGVKKPDGWLGFTRELGEPIMDGTAVRISHNKYSDIGKMVRRGDERYNLKPVAKLTATPSSVEVGEQVTLDASDSFDPDGSIEKYKWDLKKEGGVDKITRNPHITYTYKSDYTSAPTVGVIDSGGKFDEESTQLQSKMFKIQNTILSSLKFDIKNKSSCGLTCWNVKYSVQNPTEKTVKDLSADITISTEETEIWNGQQHIGTLKPDSSTLGKSKVELGYDKFKTFGESDGTVTIKIKYSSEKETDTVEYERKII